MSEANLQQLRTRYDVDLSYRLGELQFRINVFKENDGICAAETGHLVFSTLHTRDVAGTITRVLDFFPPARLNEVSNQLSLGLAYIVSQKLVPKADGKGRIVAMEIFNNSFACFFRRCSRQV